MLPITVSVVLGMIYALTFLGLLKYSDGFATGLAIGGLLGMEFGVGWAYGPICILLYGITAIFIIIAFIVRWESAKKGAKR